MAGKIFLKPSESSFASGLSRTTGDTVVIPATGETYDSVTQTFTGGGGGRPITDPRVYAQQQQAIQAEANRVAEIQRLAELEAQRKQAEAQRIVQEQLQQQKQENITMGTIGGQVSSKGKQKLFSFGDESTTITYGVPFIKQSERDRGVVGYVPQSEDLSELIEESKYSQNIQTSPSSFVSNVLGRTKADIIATQSNIFEREKIYKKDREIIQSFEEAPESFIGQEGVETKTTKSGTEISLTPEYFEKGYSGIRKSSVEESYDFFDDLTKKRKIRARTSSRATGVIGFGVGVAEFGGTIFSNLGVQTYESDEDFKSPGLFGGRQFKFGGSVGAFTSQLPIPTTEKFVDKPLVWTTQKLSDPSTRVKLGLTAGLVVFGGAGIVKNIKTYGVKGGIGETIGSLSPLRIKPGVYTAKVTSETKFDILSLKTKKGDYVTRTVLGKSEGGASLKSVQVSRILKSGIEPGIIETQITSPAFSVRGGGFTSGYSVSGFEGYSYTGGNIGKLTGLGSKGLGVSGIKQETLLSGLFEGYSQPRYNFFVSGSATEGFSFSGTYFPKTNIYKRFRGGAVSGDINEIVTGFTSGRRISIPESKVYGDVVVRQPSGTYRIKPTFTGKEFDLNKLFDLGSKGTITSRTVSTGKGGGGTTSLDKTFGSTQSLSNQLASVQSSLSSTTPVKIIAPTSSSNILLGSGLVSTTKTTTRTTSPSVTQQVKEDSITKTSTTQNLLFAQSPISKQRGRTLLIPKQSSISASKFFQPQASGLATAQASKYKQVQKQILTPTNIFRGGGGSYGTGYSYGFGGLPIFPPFRLGIPFGGSKSKRQKRKQPSQYQASLTSRVFNIRGKVPEKYWLYGFGGIRGRPIQILEPSRKTKKRKAKKK